LVVNERLKQNRSYKLREDGECGKCNLDDEFICHAIFECTLARSIWMESEFNIIATRAIDSPVKVL